MALAFSEAMPEGLYAPSHITGWCVTLRGNTPYVFFKNQIVIL